MRSNSRKLVQYSCPRQAHGRDSHQKGFAQKGRRVNLGVACARTRTYTDIYTRHQCNVTTLGECFLARIFFSIKFVNGSIHKLNTSDSLLIVAFFLLQLFQFVLEDTAALKLLMALFLASAPSMISFPLNISHPSAPRWSAKELSDNLDFFPSLEIDVLATPPTES